MRSGENVGSDPLSLAIREDLRSLASHRVRLLTCEGGLWSRSEWSGLPMAIREEDTEMAEGFADGLLAALGQQVGLQELRFDDGCCAVAFDDLVVNFEVDPPSEQLFLYAELGEAPEGLPEALYRRLLAANLLWKGSGRATLSLDDQAERFVLAHAVPALRMSEIDFVEMVESFVNIAEEWRARIADGRHPAEAVAPPSAIDPASPNMFV